MYIPKLDNKSTLAISQNRKDLFKTAPEMRAVPRARMKAKAGSFFTAGEQLTPDDRGCSGLRPARLGGPCPFFPSCFDSKAPPPHLSPQPSSSSLPLPSPFPLLSPAAVSLLSLFLLLHLRPLCIPVEGFNPPLIPAKLDALKIDAQGQLGAEVEETRDSFRHISSLFHCPLQQRRYLRMGVPHCGTCSDV